jgi:O-antigen/teichoic acid export membrane protein
MRHASHKSGAVLRSISFFFSGTVFARALGFVQTMLLARSLGPSEYGVWVLFVLIVSYVPICSLGIMETMVKRVPQFRARGELTSAQSIENAVFGAIILISGLWLAASAVLLPCYAIWGGERVAAAGLVLGVGAFNLANGYFISRFQAYEEFVTLGFIEASRAALSLACIGILGWRYGLNGAVGGYLLVEFAMLGFSGWRSAVRQGVVSPSFAWKTFWPAVQEGLPITLSWWGVLVQISVDRAVLGALMPTSAVGYYGLGAALASVVMIFPTIVGRVLYPKVNYAIHRGEGNAATSRYLVDSTRFLSMVVAYCQTGLLLGMPFLYQWVLPKYRPGLAAAVILILGSISPCLVRLPANLLIIRNLERYFLVGIVVSLAVNVFLNVLLIKSGFGLAGVAVGSSLAGAVLCVLLWVRALKELGHCSGEIALRIAEIYLPTFVLTLAAAFIHRWGYPVLTSYGWPNLAAGIALIAVVTGALWCVNGFRLELVRWADTLRKLAAFVPFQRASKAIHP